MGVAGEQVIERYGDIVKEAGRILIRRRSICRISLSNVRALAISFLVNTVWDFIFTCFSAGFIHDWGRTRLGEGNGWRNGQGKQRRRRKKRINPWMPRRKRRGRRLATRKC